MKESQIKSKRVTDEKRGRVDHRIEYVLRAWFFDQITQCVPEWIIIWPAKPPMQTSPPTFSVGELAAHRTNLLTHVTHRL